ncbi:Ion channel [Bifidobacterium dolichotidis]|uniref:Ion channel n=1 Tax=Bifidobacterium dolichotidis TaxID=2306976 RepID=A0A430FNW6_9BIFI|nr:Ion channel [Bifidobacterium dolichotidis]
MSQKSVVTMSAFTLSGKLATRSLYNLTMTLASWHKISDIPLFILSVVFLFAYSWSVLAETHVELCNAVIDCIWVIYLIDYVVSLSLAEKKRLWIKQNWLLLFTLVLPMFRPLHLLRLLAVMQIFNRTAGGAVRGRITVYAICMFSMLIYVGALAEYSVEHKAPGATITTFGDSVWWAFVTVTTVGYGEVHPVTTMGKCVAVGLMLTGIAMIGIVTAMISSWIIDQVHRENVNSAQQISEGEERRTATSAEARLLQAEMLRLTETVANLNNEIQQLHRTNKRARKHTKNAVKNGKITAETAAEIAQLHSTLVANAVDKTNAAHASAATASPKHNTAAKSATAAAVTAAAAATAATTAARKAVTPAARPVKRYRSQSCYHGPHRRPRKR